MPRVRGLAGRLAAATALATGCAIAREAGPTAPPAPAAPDATTLAPLTVRGARPNATPDATVEIPFDAEAKGHWASAWPEAAYREGIGGRVLLTCGIDQSQAWALERGERTRTSHPAFTP